MKTTDMININIENYAINSNLLSHYSLMQNRRSIVYNYILLKFQTFIDKFDEFEWTPNEDETRFTIKLSSIFDIEFKLSVSTSI